MGVEKITGRDGGHEMEVHRQLEALESLTRKMLLEEQLRPGGSEG